MNQINAEKQQWLNNLAKADATYMDLLEQMKQMENHIDLLENSLEIWQRNLIWDFWGLSQSIEERKQQLALQYIENWK